MTTQQLTSMCNTPTESYLLSKFCLKGSKAKVQTCSISRQHDNLVAKYRSPDSRFLVPLHLLSKLLSEIGKMLYAHDFISVAKIVDTIAVACFNVKFPGAPLQSVLLLLLLLH
jgi:hypothetical protein